MTHKIVVESPTETRPYRHWWSLTAEARRRLPFEGIATRSTLGSVEEYIRLAPPTLAICHPDWHGIRQATYGQGFPVLEFPGVVSWEHEEALVHFFGLWPLKTLVLNGIPLRSAELFRQLKLKHPHLEILVIYHGSLSQPYHEDESGSLEQVIAAAQAGIIDRLGVVKTGLRRVFSTFGVRTFDIWNFPETPRTLREIPLELAGGAVSSSAIVPTSAAPFSVSTATAIKETTTSGKIWHVGVLGSSWAHKNLFVQIVSLCRLPNVVIHVLKKPRIHYLKHCKAPIVEHGPFLTHDKFIRVVGRMDLTLYVSLTECFPMTVVESIGMGIPALTSATSVIYDSDPVLKERLVVMELDSPDHIADQVEKVLENYEEICLRLWQLTPYLHWKAAQKFQLFLQNRTDEAAEDNGKRSDGFRYVVPGVTATEATAPASTRKKSIVFVVDRSWLESPRQLYGPAVMVLGLVAKLSSAEEGHSITVLTDANPEDAETWLSAVPGVELKHVTGIIGTQQTDTKTPLEKSRLFAQELERLYQQKPFDVVEFPDELGLAYEVLRARTTDRGLDESSVIVTAALNQLPRSVAIHVRMHGTQQLLDQQKQTTASLSNRNSLAYFMEQYCLVGAADQILVPDAHWKPYYRLVYGIHENLLSVAPTPWREIAEKVWPKVDASSAAAIPWKSSTSFLIYGDLRSWSLSLEPLVQSLLELLDSHKDDTLLDGVQFVFVGGDYPWITSSSPSSLEEQSHRLATVSDLIMDLVPDEWEDSFQVYTGPLTKEEWSRLSQSMFAAIHSGSVDPSAIGSTTATSNRIPMELAQLAYTGIPLLVERNPLTEWLLGPDHTGFFHQQDLQQEPPLQQGSSLQQGDRQPADGEIGLQDAIVQSLRDRVHLETLRENHNPDKLLNYWEHLASASSPTFNYNRDFTRSAATTTTPTPNHRAQLLHVKISQLETTLQVQSLDQSHMDEDFE